MQLHARDKIITCVLVVTALVMSIVLVVNKISDSSVFPSYKIKTLVEGNEYERSQEILGIAIYANNDVENISYLVVLDFENTYIFELDDKYEEMFLNTDGNIAYAKSSNDNYLVIDFTDANSFNVKKDKTVDESLLEVSDIYKNWNAIEHHSDEEVAFLYSYGVRFPTASKGYYIYDGFIGGY